MISGSLSPRHGASSGCGWRNGLQIRRIAANILNKRSRTTDKGCPPVGGLGEVLIAPHRKSVSCYDPFAKASDLVACCCECGSEHSGSIKWREFLD